MKKNQVGDYLFRNDEDALLADFQLDDVDTTPLESRKKFRNTWYTMSRNGINDFTEKAVLFIMAD